MGEIIGFKSRLATPEVQGSCLKAVTKALFPRRQCDECHSGTKCEDPRCAADPWTVRHLAERDSLLSDRAYVAYDGAACEINPDTVA